MYQYTATCESAFTINPSDRERSPKIIWKPGLTYPGFQRPQEERRNRTSGFTKHPVVSCIQSEASIPILGYSVIGQKFPIFTTQCFGSTSNSCEKLRPTVICPTTGLRPGVSGIQGSFICKWPTNSPFLFVCIISCTAL